MDEPDLGNVDVGVLVPHELNIVLRQVLADNLPAAVAGGIVPLAVDHRHAGLLAQAAGRGKPVGLVGAPLVHSLHKDSVDGAVSGQHLYQGGGPEPAVDVERLVVRSITPSHLQ